jgi:hypothetical protein
VNRALATFGRNLISDLGVATRSGVRALPNGALKALPIAGWAVAAILLGLLVGIAAVVLPPTGVFAIPSAAFLILLWAMPDLASAPKRTLRALFFIVLVVDLCVPNYYTYQVSGLPWISVHRLFTFPLIMTFAVVVSSSSQARSQIAETLGAAKPIAIGAIGFLVMIIASIFTSSSSGESLGQTVDVFLNWYVPLFALALLIRTEADFFKLVRVIGWCTIFVALAGVLEFILQRRIFIDVMPASLKAALMEANPSFANMATMSSFRMGMYRASSISASLRRWSLHSALRRSCTARPHGAESSAW